MIQARGLWRTFGRFEALQGLSFSVPEGSAYALIGANGAGKTTTIKTVVNIIEPSKGSVEILGVDSRDLSPKEFRQLGYVSENQEMPARLTVEEFIAYLRPFYPEWDRSLEHTILSQLSLPLKRRIGDLSHGMRMKLALACALPYRPSLLVLDEPFSGLDPLIRDDFMDGILRQAGDMTIFISSHELSELDGVATHVGFIEHGRLLFEDSMSDLGARFREVLVSVDDDEIETDSLPSDWLNVRRVGSTLRFVETRFSEDGFGERVRAAIGEVTRIDTEPMALREIFTTLARANRL